MAKIKQRIRVEAVQAVDNIKLAALAIVKTALVVGFFMHLRY